LRASTRARAADNPADREPLHLDQRPSEGLEAIGERHARAGNGFDILRPKGDKTELRDSRRHGNGRLGRRPGAARVASRPGDQGRFGALSRFLLGSHEFFLAPSIH
jgi:hypothetical protein